MLLQKKDHLIERVKKILDQVLCVDCDGHEMTMAMCIKTLRNKFICHYDNFEDYDIAGNEGVGDGKWTPDDRDVLFRVLFAYENSPVSMLVNEMSKVMDVAAQQGVDEILDGLVKSKFGDSFTKDAEVGVVAADTDE